MPKTRAHDFCHQTNMSTKTQENKEEANASKSEGAKAEDNKPKFKKEELLAIFDDIVFSGSFEEDIDIRGKLKVTFRSRSADDTLAISKDIDGTSFNLITTVQERRALLNLAYSLVKYQGKDLGGMAIADRLSYLGKLAAPLVGALSVSLSKFDQKVEAACVEGEANF